MNNNNTIKVRPYSSYGKDIPATTTCHQVLRCHETETSGWMMTIHNCNTRGLVLVLSNDTINTNGSLTQLIPLIKKH